MKYFIFALLFLFSPLVNAQTEKTCIHNLEFPDGVRIKTMLPCKWAKENVETNKGVRKFLYKASNVNYTAVVAVTSLPITPDSATRAQMLSDDALRESGKEMGTIISTGKIKIGTIDAVEMIVNGKKDAKGEQKHGYMLQCYTILGNKIVIMNFGTTAMTDKTAQTAFEQYKNLFRKYLNGTELTVK